MLGAKHLYEFGPFRLDPTERLLLRDNQPVPLAPKAFDTLVLLVENSGRLLTKDELIKRLWPGTFVEEVNLAQNISAIRRALHDKNGGGRYIETVSKAGYRFIAEVRSVSSAIPEATPAAEAEPVVSAAPRWKRRWLVLVFPLAALAVGLIAWNVKTWRERVLAVSSSPHIQSLAVLPLENLSGDREQEFFADGMTDELITDLAKIHSLRVISRNSVMQYKSKRKSLPQIARDLNVDAVIEGTVQRFGDRVRIRVQLIEGPKDRHLWAESYERPLRDVLALQDEVAMAITREIKVKLLPAENSRLASAQSINSEAYELYLKGRYFWNKRDPEGLRKALDYFQRAAEKAPGYAPVHAGLADTYSLLGTAAFDALPAADGMDKARAAAKLALSIDDGIAEAHASLGFVTYRYDWDWSAAEQEFKRAIALNPNYAAAHRWYSDFLTDLGRRDESLSEARAALALDPLSLIDNENLARVHYFAREFDEAVEGSKKTLEMNPNFPIAHMRLGRAYAAKGMYREANREFEVSKSLGNIPLATASIGNTLARSGDRPGAMRALDQLASLAKHQRVPAICFALVYTGLGENDQTMAWLEKAYTERSDFLIILKVDPVFDGLHDDARFRDLLRRIGLQL